MVKTYSLQDREEGRELGKGQKVFDYFSPDGKPMIHYRYCEICSFSGAFEPGSLRTVHRTRGFRTEAAARRAAFDWVNRQPERRDMLRDCFGIDETANDDAAEGRAHYARIGEGPSNG